MSSKGNITKINQFINALPEIDGVVITDPANLAYVTGLNFQRLASVRHLCVIAFFSAEKRFIACPKVLASAYQNAGWHDSIITYANSIDTELAAVKISAAFISELFEGVHGTLGYIGDEMTQRFFEKLLKQLPGFSFADISDEFSRLRQVKSPVEMRILEDAASRTDHGIAAAILGGLNPIGAIFSSFFIQHITDGGQYVNTNFYSSQISDVISSIIIYLCGFVLFIKLTMNRTIARNKEKKEARK